MTTDLRNLLQQQIDAPQQESQFLRELVKLSDAAPPSLEGTIDIMGEVTRILSHHFFRSEHVDLILKLRPDFADYTIDPQSTIVRDARSSIAHEAPPRESRQTRHSLGATIAPPEPLHRLGKNSIHLNSSIGDENLELGDAWLASDATLHRHILLRALDSTTSTDDGALDQFIREAQIVGQLEHPNIIPVYSLAWTADNKPYYTMKFLDGQNLHQHIHSLHQKENRLTRQSLRSSLEILQAVCNAISYSHSRGVYHGQIFSNAISLGEFGEVMVLNWTNAILCDEPAEARELRRNDIRSIGAMLFEILSGTPVLELTRSDVETLPKNTPPTLISILQACCQKDSPYSTARDLGLDLRKYASDQVVMAHRDSVGELVRRWSRHHPMHVLFATATTMLVAFSLLAETFILWNATNKAETVLARNKDLTQQLFRDNDQIAVEQRVQQNATAKSVKALDEAKRLLKLAETDATRALTQRDLTINLKKQSEILEGKAIKDYETATKQEEVAAELLGQARKDATLAQKATNRLRNQSIDALYKQTVFHVYQGRIDESLRSARTLYPILKPDFDPEARSNRLLLALAFQCYALQPAQDTGANFDKTTTQQLYSADPQLIVLSQYDETKHQTTLHFLEPAQERQVTIEGSIIEYDATPSRFTAITNDETAAVVAIISSDGTSYHRLPGQCVAAAFHEDRLYATLADNSIITFSLAELTVEQSITSIHATSIAVSPQGSMVAVTGHERGIVYNINNSELVQFGEFSIPSAVTALWFPSESRVAMLSNRYYLNEFLIEVSLPRKIRFTPDKNDIQLSSQFNFQGIHYLLFAKGTLVRLSKELTIRQRVLAGAVNGTISSVDSDHLLITGRDGTVHELNAETLFPTAAPTILNTVPIAAKNSDNSIHLITSDGKRLIGTRPDQHDSFITLPPKQEGKAEFLAGDVTVYQPDSQTLVAIQGDSTASTYYKHPKEITSFRSLANGRILALQDDSNYIFFKVSQHGKLQDAVKAPLDTALTSLQYHPESDQLIFCNPTTLYVLSAINLTTFSHPTVLKGLIQTAVSEPAGELLITASRLDSTVFHFDLTKDSYGKPIHTHGFIRNVAWSDAQQNFLIITSHRDEPDRHYLSTISATGYEKTVPLPFSIKEIAFDHVHDQAFVATPDNTLLSISLDNYEITNKLDFPRSIDNLTLTHHDRHLLVSATNSVIALDPDHLTPISPLVDGLFIKPQRIGNITYCIQRTDAGFIKLPMDSLLGNKLTVEHLETVFTQ